VQIKVSIKTMSDVPAESRVSLVIDHIDGVMVEKRSPSRTRPIIDLVVLVVVQLGLLLPLYAITVGQLVRERRPQSLGASLAAVDLLVFSLVAANLLLDVCLVVSAAAIVCCRRRLHGSVACSRVCHVTFYEANSVRRMSLHTVHTLAFLAVLVGEC